MGNFVDTLRIAILGGLLCMAGACGFDAAASDDAHTSFREEEVRKNIAMYLDVVFGGRAPTEKDYQRLDRGEQEWGLQIELCERKLGHKFEEDGPNTACYAWLHEHGIGESDSRSIYYQLLRRRVGR